VLAAHEGAVLCMHSTDMRLATGGSDGRAIMWKATSTGLAKTSTFDLATMGAGVDVGSSGIQARPPLDPRIRSICISPDRKHQRLLVGTFGCELYLAALSASTWEPPESSRTLPTHLVASGHAGHEARALACHPRFADVIATAGDDHTLRLWSASQGVEIVQAELAGMCRSIDWSPNGGVLAVGLGGRFGEGGVHGHSESDGLIMLLDAENLSILARQRDCR